jgi:hypothetical protein
MSAEGKTGLLATFLVAGCSGGESPPWSGGAMVREERPADTAPQRLDNLAARLLAVHNRERAAVGTSPLRWDPRLAAAAAAYGPSLAARGRLEHSPRESRPGQGENLWMGTGGAYSLEDMAGSWAAEKALFRPGTFPDVSRNGNWADVAHYTQMIWGGTSSVGCALHRARQWDYLICRYASPGNVVGQPVP